MILRDKQETRKSRSSNPYKMSMIYSFQGRLSRKYLGYWRFSGHGGLPDMSKEEKDSTRGLDQEERAVWNL